MTEENWQKIETSPTQDWQLDKELIGIFMEKEEGVGENNSNLYTFKRSDGSLISVWGNAILDMRFKSLIQGEEVRILYQGKTKSPKTGRSYHNFDVFHRQASFEPVADDSGSLEINDANAQAQGAEEQ